jgi:hypothetical protein
VPAVVVGYHGPHSTTWNDFSVSAILGVITVGVCQTRFVETSLPDGDRPLRELVDMIEFAVAGTMAVRVTSKKL